MPDEQQDAVLRIAELTQRLDDLEVGRGVTVTDKAIAEVEMKLQASLLALHDKVKDFEDRIARLEHGLSAVHGATAHFKGGG